jgi:hypothetical protein
MLTQFLSFSLPALLAVSPALASVPGTFRYDHCTYRNFAPAPSQPGVMVSVFTCDNSDIVGESVAFDCAAGTQARYGPSGPLGTPAGDESKWGAWGRIMDQFLWDRACGGAK